MSVKYVFQPFVRSELVNVCVIGPHQPTFPEYMPVIGFLEPTQPHLESPPAKCAFSCGGINKQIKYANSSSFTIREYVYFH